MTESQGPGTDWQSRRIRQSPQVVSNQLGDAGVLVHLQSNRIFELNATGLRIWQLAAGAGASLGEIAATLGRDFDAGNARIEGELLRLVDELSREGLIESDRGN